MSKINGHGGFWVANPVDEATLTRIDNAEYEADVDVIDDETTDSGSDGEVEGIPCVVKLNSLTMTVAEDDGFYLTALGLSEGERVNIYLKRGAVNQWDYARNTMVKNVRNANPQDKARRITITCCYGRILRNVSPPPGFGG